MDLNAFFQDNERYKYIIAKYLELRKNYSIRIDDICNFCSLSNYKVKSFLEEINSELKLLSKEAEITIIKDGEIVATGLDSLLIKKLRLGYLQNSEVYIFFRYILTTQGKLKDFSAAHYFSKTKTYQLKTQLSLILQDFQVSYKKSKLKGDELAIRNLLYSIYYDFYNGLSLPFSEEIAKEVEVISNYLDSVYQMQMSNTKQTKLLFFIGGALERIRQGNVIVAKNTIISENDNVVITRLARYLNLSREETIGEWQYMVFFMFCEEMITDQHIETTVKQTFARQTTTLSIDTAEHIFSDSQLETQLTVLEYQDYCRRFAQLICRINLKNEYFYNSMETFSTEYSFLFFQESYPQLTQVIQETVNNLSLRGIFDQDIKIRLYYDYLLALLDLIDISHLERKLYICVDFSHGDIYTHYIASQISRFINLNVVLQKHTTAKTDIFLSDFAIEKLGCVQIIWKSPPTADDWAEFGDVIAEIKNGKGNL